MAIGQCHENQEMGLDLVEIWCVIVHSITLIIIIMIKIMIWEKRLV